MTRTALLPALLLAFSLAACGGEDEPEPLTKAEFTTQADKICADGFAELQAAAEDFSAEPTEEEVEAFATETFLPNMQQQHDDLADLGAPEGDEDEVSAILDALQEGIDATEADPAVLLSTDDPFTEANELAGEYGLVECAG